MGAISSVNSQFNFFRLHWHMCPKSITNRFQYGGMALFGAAIVVADAQHIATGTIVDATTMHWHRTLDSVIVFPLVYALSLSLLYLCVCVHTIVNISFTQQQQSTTHNRNKHVWQNYTYIKAVFECVSMCLLFNKKLTLLQVRDTQSRAEQSRAKQSGWVI